MAKLKKGYVKCPLCSQQFSRIDWLRDHIKEKHPHSVKKYVG